MCDLYEAARHNLPWLEGSLWASLALGGALALAGLALRGRAGEGGGG